MSIKTMDSNKKALLKISVLIDKMSVISEDLLGQDFSADTPDIDVLMQYNDKLQGLLNTFSSGSVAEAFGISEEKSDAEVIDEKFTNSAEAEVKENLEDFKVSELNEDVPEIEKVEEVPDFISRTEIVDEAELKEAIIAPVENVPFINENINDDVTSVEDLEVHEPLEVNELFPKNERSISESLDSKEDINKMYESDAPQDINASFSEDAEDLIAESSSNMEDISAPSESTKDYAESIQDQILNTIKDIGTDVKDNGMSIAKVAAAGAAALGINKLTSESKEETEEDMVQEKNLQEEVAHEPEVINEEHNSADDDSFFDFTEMNLNDSASTEPELNDQFVTETATVEVSEKLKKSFSGDLKQNIDINDRFTFIQTLFNGDYGAFDGTISSINKCSSYKDAVILLEQNVIGKYRWNEKEDVASQFIEIIRQKFI